MSDIVTAASQQPPPEAFVAEVESRLGGRTIAWTPPDTGLSAAMLFIVTLEDGRRVFLKAATDAQTQSWLENERLALEHAPAGMAPRVVGHFSAESGFSVLLTEALDGHWPASHQGLDWRNRLDEAIAAIVRLSENTGPAVLPSAGNTPPAVRWAEGPLVEGAVQAGVASGGWFADHIPMLRRAEASLDRSGSAFVHGDMRSDNVCLMADGPRFVDWSSAARGAPETDLAAFLPAARLEGGPPPEAVLPRGGSWAAAQAAQMAALAMGDAVPAWLSRVCWRLVVINLDWAVASLGMDSRDGARWEDL